MYLIKIRCEGMGQIQLAQDRVQSRAFSVYKILVGKRQEKRPRGRPTRRWKDNIESMLVLIKNQSKQCC
jgi:hypothetical protein